MYHYKRVNLRPHFESISVGAAFWRIRVTGQPSSPIKKSFFSPWVCSRPWKVAGTHRQWFVTRNGPDNFQFHGSQRRGQDGQPQLEVCVSTVGQAIVRVPAAGHCVCGTALLRAPRQPNVTINHALQNQRHSWATLLISHKRGHRWGWLKFSKSDSMVSCLFCSLMWRVWKCGFFLTLVSAVNHPTDRPVKQLSVLSAGTVKSGILFTDHQIIWSVVDLWLRSGLMSECSFCFLKDVFISSLQDPKRLPFWMLIGQYKVTSTNHRGVIHRDQLFTL